MTIRSVSNRRGSRVARWSMFALFLIVPVAALAASSEDPVAPSKAPTLQVGVPWTGLWATRQMEFAWMRLPSALHRKDTLQFAVSNDSRWGVRFCLVSPVDDFGADQARRACSWTQYTEGGRKNRVAMTYLGATGQPYLVIAHQCDGFCGGNQGGTWTLTLEKIGTWYSLAWKMPPRTVPKKVALTVAVRHGDNTPASNGTPVRLFAKKTGTGAYQQVASSQTRGGSAVLRATLAKKFQGGTIDLSACAGVIGKDPRSCIAVRRVNVR